MAKRPANVTRIYLDQYDLSGYLNASTQEIVQETPKADTFSDTGPRRVVGNYDVKHSDNGLFDGANDAIDEILAALISGYERILNGDFEVYTGTLDNGVSDAWTSWTDIHTDAGSLAEATATAHGGAAAVKLTSGSAPADGCEVYQNITVVGGDVYTLRFWTRGDGSFAGRYYVYDVTNGAFITVRTTTGITAATYTEVQTSFTVPATCVSVRIGLLPSATASKVAYFDDCSVTLSSSDAADHYLGKFYDSLAEGQIAYESVVALDGEAHAAKIGDLILLNFTSQGANGVSRGVIIRTAIISGNGNGTGRNVGASTSGQTYQSIIRVISGTFTSFDVNVQESSDDAAGDPYATIAGLSQTGITGTGVWRNTVTTATEAWKRVNIANWVGTSAVILVTTGLVKGT